MYRNDIPNIDLASSNLVYYLDHHLRGTGHEGMIEHPKDPKKARVRCLPAPHPVYDLDSVAYPAGEELRTRAKGRLHKGRIWAESPVDTVLPSGETTTGGSAIRFIIPAVQ